MTYHIPVLLKESIELLNLKEDGTYVDATLGGGGHTEAMLKNRSVKQVFAFDQDEDAIVYASKRLQGHKGILTCIEANFEDLRTELALQKVKTIDGILFDLGVSSHQIDEAERGFSFEKDAILDMRMSRKNEQKATDLLNNLSVRELAKIFNDFGEEQAAYKIAQWIIKARNEKPIKTTKDLSVIIDKNLRVNPILNTKTKVRIFQALRIYINRELEVLDTALTDAINLLKPGGRMVVISYHSLEDKLVKSSIKKASQGCICSKSVLKCSCNQKPRVRILTGKSIVPSANELEVNRRSRSARLRAIEKL
jgi:16S rRNA (cytosine1402-N4)-methyltransferase